MSNDQLPAVTGEHFAVPSSGASAGAVALAVHGGGAVTGDSAGGATDAGEATYEGWAKAVGLEPSSPIVARTRQWLSKITARSKAQLTAQVVAEREAEQLTVDQDDAEQGVAKMRAEWGQAYERNIQAIVAWVATLPPAVNESMTYGRIADGTRLANTPAGLRWMLQQATRRAPARENNGATLEQRIRDIEFMMKDRRSRYYRGPDSEQIQTEYRNLINQRDGR